MASRLQFLVIDDNPDSRFLLVKTLLRKFPEAGIDEAQHSDLALEKAANPELSAIICHRSAETTGLALLQEIRAINSQAPLVMVSGIDRRALALAGGANRFLLYDEWLRIGTVVEELITAEERESPK